MFVKLNLKSKNNYHGMILVDFILYFLNLMETKMKNIECN